MQRQSHRRNEYISLIALLELCTIFCAIIWCKNLETNNFAKDLIAHQNYSKPFDEEAL